MKLYQMDVKSISRNGLIQEEVYVDQPLGFESDTYPNRVFKLNRALYRLKQDPRAWYKKLSSFFLLTMVLKEEKWTQLFSQKL